MRSILIVSCFWVALGAEDATGQGHPSKYADVVSASRLNEIMLLPSTTGDWVPDTFLDLRYEWPETSVEESYQPFDAFVFAKNAAAVALLVKAKGRDFRTERMARFLSFIAEQYIVSDGSCAYVTNDFDYHQYWSIFQRGFRGAFMNAVTAYGYLELYATFQEESYLQIGRLLLKSAAECETDDVRLHALDENGNFWLNEYVFKIPNEDKALFRAFGFQEDPDGHFRARIYNGHIHALLSYVKYAQLTKSDEFDNLIEKSIETMKAVLPNQLYDGRYFSYAVEFPMFPDYGQERAVLLAEGLCEISRDQILCETAHEMRVVFDGSIKADSSEIYDAAYSFTRTLVEQWRDANQ